MPTVPSHFGALVSGMKMSEMNRSGRMTALTTAGAASAFGTTVVIARPIAENDRAPMARLTRKAGMRLPARLTP